MDTFHERCCGLDVHKKSVVACVLTPEGQEVRTFSTMTKDLLALADWLKEREVTHVAMESSGVYWVPVFNLLEDEFTVMVVNARHMKAVPGRKTDVKDAEWIADLLRHGLLRASFIPDRPQGEFAGVDPLPPQPERGAQPGGEPDSEAFGRGQHQAGLRGHRWAYRRRGAMCIPAFAGKTGGVALDRQLKDPGRATRAIAFYLAPASARSSDCLTLTVSGVPARWNLALGSAITSSGAIALLGRRIQLQIRCGLIIGNFRCQLFRPLATL